MTDSNTAIVPVWTLATQDVRVPAFAGDEPMSGERLSELRGVLATLADHPVATLEAHPLPAKLDRSRGISLDAASPLAQHLSQLVTQSAPSSTAATAATETGEVLYRMVVPAKFAAQLGSGTVKSMSSKAAPGAIHGVLTSSKGIVGTTSFVPVGKAASGAAGATGGAAAATAGTAAATTAVVTVAAPLVLMAVAVGASAYADQQRRQAIDRITDLLEQLRDEDLDRERAELDGCRDAIDKATAILLDQGKLGVSLGLDSAVHAVGKSLAAADRRVAHWQGALDALPDGQPVEVGLVTEAFPGIDDEGGLFAAQLELAALAVALKRRVIILQAVEHAQSDPGNQFESFSRTLKADQQRIDTLETGIGRVLLRLSTLELTRPATRRPAFTGAQVDRLLRTTSSIRRLGDGISIDRPAADVSIEIARDRDGSVVVFPALAA